MDRLTQKFVKRLQRRHRIRHNISGTASRPRLAVTISNTNVSAQIIDDHAGKTLVYASTVGAKVQGPMSAKAEFVGTEIAKKAAKAKINKVVFDRAGRKYHGRVKALAEAARAGGLEF